MTRPHSLVVAAALSVTVLVAVLGAVACEDGSGGGEGEGEGDEGEGEGEPCTETATCGFGQTCSDDVCTQDERGPFCATCEGGIDTDDCGEPTNYCLTQEDGSGACGVDCTNAECPAGYACSSIIVAPPGAPLCEEAADCEAANGAAGYCDGTDTPCADDVECGAAVCNLYACTAAGECTCAHDADCPADTCDTEEGRCSFQGTLCEIDEDCGSLTCLQGACKVGQNCAPANPLTCADAG